MFWIIYRSVKKKGFVGREKHTLEKNAQER